MDRRHIIGAKNYNLASAGFTFMICGTLQAGTVYSVLLRMLEKIISFRY